MKGLIFLCCACSILVFTIINISVGPFTSGILSSNWGYANCEYLSYQHDKAKDNPSKTDDSIKYNEKWLLDRCNRIKGMHDMEYTSFIFDIVIGFVCGLLALLHYFELKKEFVPKTGIIGLCCGIIGFIFSFVYVILNGLVYTSYYDNANLYKRDSDGIFAEGKGSYFECKYFDSAENHRAYIAKYSDLIQKQYNYDEDLMESFTKSPVVGCKDLDPTDCDSEGKITKDTAHQNCQNLYVNNVEMGFENKDKSDRFLTTLLLSLFACLANIGLAIFGFLLYRTPGDF